MKKIITIFTFLISVSLIAGPKADLEKASKLISENKEKEAISLLEKTKPVKGEENEYEQINYALAANYISKNDEDNAKKYFQKISDNKNSKSDIAKGADQYLMALASDDSGKILYLERLSERFDNKNYEILSELNAYYVLNKLDEKASSLNKVIKEQGENFEDIVSLFTGEVLVPQDFDLANTYIKKALKSKNPKIQIEAHILLASYYLAKKDYKKVEEEVNLAEKINPSDAMLLARIGDIYKSMGNENKNYEYLKKAYKLDSKQLSIVIALIESSYDRNDKKDQNVWSGVARNLNKDVNDLELAKLFMQKEKIELAKEFAIKASKENNEANYLLFVIYINEYNKEEMLKYADKILKTGTDEEKLAVTVVKNNPELALSEIAYSNGNLNKSLEFAKKAAKKNHEADLMLAQIYIKLGDINEAKKYLESSVKNKVNVKEAKSILDKLNER
ncbi:tetratricopeptide repeat protein [Oceanivirga miroungae]|uniref:Lipopolysaccharide assembly protein B n=1 Tax=Oceanivirga miroungae TaxID=1130046 RepID=A0A6I8MCW7_9FUSO|nr:tetratricopeptide repeat protein [Oceanivirga miroungae]VWL85332.1 Lipopolysaccharide assembly protein B [Oceanivirga miroungae]